MIILANFASGQSHPCMISNDETLALLLSAWSGITGWRWELEFSF